MAALSMDCAILGRASSYPQFMGIMLPEFSVSTNLTSVWSISGGGIELVGSMILMCQDRFSMFLFSSELQDSRDCYSFMLSRVNI